MVFFSGVAAASEPAVAAVRLWISAGSYPFMTFSEISIADASISSVMVYSVCVSGVSNTNGVLVLYPVNTNLPA